MKCFSSFFLWLFVLLIHFRIVVVTFSLFWPFIFLVFINKCFLCNVCMYGLHVYVVFVCWFFFFFVAYYYLLLSMNNEFDFLSLKEWALLMYVYVLDWFYILFCFLFSNNNCFFFFFLCSFLLHSPPHPFKIFNDSFIF